MLRTTSILLLACLLPRVLHAQTTENVLLLMNENSEDSKSIARHYAAKRKLPLKNICRIRTTEAETISRTTFERAILRPVANYLKSNQLQDQILYIVTTRGIPLIVEGDDGPVGDLASVDSALTLTYQYLVFGTYPYRGRFENPYFAINFTKDDFRPFLRRDYDIYLVTRLTGASIDDAKRLVDLSLSAGPSGSVYFDLGSAKQSTAAEWLKRAALTLQEQGMKVTVENSGRLLDNLSRVAGYAAEPPADRNLARPIPNIQWGSGAIATVFDRVTARTFAKIGPEERDAADTGLTASRYIAQGVTGFGGYVADPTEDGYLRPQILFPAYAANHNLAESFYAASRYLHWRSVIIGDPLATAFDNQAAHQRNAFASACRPKLDGETGLPAEFSRRRKLYLMQQYSTSSEAVAPLLRAGAAADIGDVSTALRFVNESLQQDPYIKESHFLKAEILEGQSDFAGAFESYTRAFEPGRSSRELYLRLARLALEKLKRPDKAITYTSWLYSQYGLTDPEIARMHAEAEFQNGRLENAVSVYVRLISEVKPPPPHALAALGRIHYEQGKFELARSLLKRALDGLTDDPGALDRYGAAKESFALSLDQSAVKMLLEQIASRKSEEIQDVSVTLGSKASRGNDNKLCPARPILTTPILYPEVRQGRVEETVVVSLLIDEMGQLMKSEVKSGPKALAQAVLKAVQQWRFEPQLVNGRPEVSRLFLTFNSKLRDSP